MDTITSKDQKLIIFAQIVDNHIRVGGDDLLLGGKFGALLEFKVSDGTGQSKVAVDAAEVDKPTGGGNASLLACSNESSVSKLKPEPPLPTGRSTNLHFAACGRRTVAWPDP